MNRPPETRIVMTLLVRNEADIIRHSLDFHLAQGVDHFLIMDHGSEDGTVDVLREFADRGLAHVMQQPDPGYRQSAWVTAMARRAALDLGADWVINSDADEFWWPTQGNLKSVLGSTPAGTDVLFVARHDFPPTADRDGDFLERMIHRKWRSTNYLGLPLPGKACHRGAPDVEVDQGNHDCRSPAFGAKRDTDRIEILHFPVRSLTQITRKIACGGRAYELSPELPREVGDAWRALYRRLESEGLDGYFASQCIDPQGADLRDGQLVLDTRLRDFMRAVGPATGSAT
jgi:hypothetical protein